MTPTKQRITEYVAAHQPIKRNDLLREIGISGKALDRDISALKNSGFIYSMPGVGYFDSQKSCEEWRKNDGVQHLKARAMMGAISSMESRRENNKTYPARVLSLLSQRGWMSAAQMVEALCVDYKKISSVISGMIATGEIKFKGAKGHRIYSIGTARKRVVRNTASVNVICQECRRSPAMQRVLSIYGRRA